MITISQKIKTTPYSEQLVLTKGIDYLKEVRQFNGCLSFQLSKNIEENNLFYFQSCWKTLEDANYFFQNGLNIDLTPDWNLKDHTIELDCKAVNVSFQENLSENNKKGEYLISKLNKIANSSLSIRKRPVLKYASSHLTPQQLDQFLEQIKNHMEEFEPFKRKDLTLVKFAKEVGLHSHHVSRVINEKLDQNFSDFVNSYRVELARKLLVKDLLQRYTISGIGDESGFNSRSAFYNAFKKFAGMSPGEFIDQNKFNAQVA
jgi:AraC-like DNA-binding protein